jgi:hypothetical protein
MDKSEKDLSTYQHQTNNNSNFDLSYKLKLTQFNLHSL